MAMWKEVYLKNASPLSDQRISELLSAVSIKDFEEFFRLRMQPSSIKPKLRMSKSDLRVGQHIHLHILQNDW